MVLLVLMLLVAAVFADIGPGPVHPALKVTLYKGGERYTGEANATYLCSAAKERGIPKGAVEPGDMPLNCGSGYCFVDSWYYKFNPCFASTGRVEVKTPVGSAVSSEFTMKEGNEYQYDMDIASGALSGGNAWTGMCPFLPAFIIAILGVAVFRGLGQV
jgi:hypothetical protein